MRSRTEAVLLLSKQQLSVVESMGSMGCIEAREPKWLTSGAMAVMSPHTTQAAAAFKANLPACLPAMPPQAAYSGCDRNLLA